MGAGNMKRCLILLLACLLLTGCAARSGTAAEQELNVALSMYPVTMDAQLAADAGSAQYIDLICGRLLRLDPEKGYVPELARASRSPRTDAPTPSACGRASAIPTASPSTPGTLSTPSAALPIPSRQAPRSMSCRIFAG